MVAYNPAVLDYLREDSPAIRYELSRDILPLLGRAAVFNEGIIDIAIVGKNQNWLSMTGGGVFIRDNDILFPERGTVYFSEKMEYLSSDWDSDCIVIGTNIFSIDPGSFGEQLGRAAVIADVDEIPWIGSLQTESMSTRFYLLDRNGNVFASDESDRLAEHPDISSIAEVQDGKPILINGVRYIAQVSDLPYIEGRILGLTPVTEVLADVMKIRTIMIIILGSALVLITVTLVFVARNVLVPISSVTKFISRIKRKDVREVSERLEIGGYTEIVTMAEEFNSMLDRIGELTGRLIAANTRVLEAELVKKHTEVTMLQSQINPHFLYNTLESVKGMAIEAGATRVVDMTKALGRMFKYAVKADEVVPLAEEIDILKAYIFIQQIRFRDRFVAEYSLEENALQCMIPKMILQPLVENAVTHGLEMKKSGGKIDIIAAANEGLLEIRISDNGAGIGENDLRRIQEILGRTDNVEDFKTMRSQPIGLRNVQTRIKLLHGLRYGVSLESRVDGGTKVTIRLPVEMRSHV